MNNMGIDDAIIDAWVGQKNGMNQKVKNSNFSVCAFFFGGFYFIYRKMYLIGIIDLIITMAVSAILNFIQLTELMVNGNLMILLSIIPAAIAIINGFIFYPLYRNHIRSKLQQNRNMNPFQVAQMKGGVSSAGAGISIGVVFVIAVILVVLLAGIGMVLFGGILNELSDRINGKSDSDFYNDYYNNYYDYDYDYDYDDYDWNQLMKEYEIDFENDYNWDI